MPLGFDGPTRFGHERVELMKGIDAPHGQAHFVMARGTFINADMRVSSFRQWQSVVEVHFFSAPTSRQFSATGHQQSFQKIRHGADAPASPFEA